MYAFKIVVYCCCFPLVFNLICGQTSFTKVSTDGNADVLERYAHLISSLRCAILCDDIGNSHCKGFSFDPDTMICILYSGTITTTPSFGNEVYIKNMDCNSDGFEVVSMARVNYCYKSVTTSMNYQNAKNYCNSLVAHLLHFDSLGEYDAVATVSSGLYGWVGANDIQVEDTWVCEKHGTPLDTSVWVWKGGEPNNNDGHEDCAVIHYSNKMLNDIPCHLTRPFVCEKEV